MTDRRLRLIAVALAVVGLAVAAYLTYVHYEGLAPVCGLGGDCEKVQTSAWSKLAGVPVAVLGLAGYVLILGSLLVRTEGGLMAGALLSLGGFGFSAYLTYREVFTIDAICPWCVGSAVLLTLLAVITVTRLVRAEPED
ncbi:MAG: hypothetical protein QOI62_343 [Solirubrobacteraceae bacterium]|jgi:uncharacterized membrane protein|nr:hypothetical protein [Solirubrobacteraceae bacterium]MEA2357083.1 hypothetical protein [Solirubrobacteraceae bacterium]MEA2392528.1 hypothetical protein [Solirubrobacteraceae bacterium]